MFDCWPPVEIGCYRCEGRQLFRGVRRGQDTRIKYICPHCKAATTTPTENLLEIMQMVAMRQNRDSIWYSQRWFFTLNARYQGLALPVAGAVELEHEGPAWQC